MATKKTTAPATYLLRGVDGDVWARFKARAAAQRVDMRDVLVRFVHAYADGDLSIEHTTTISASARRARK